MESLILHEVSALNAKLKTQMGEPLDMTNQFGISVINALWTILVGKRHELDDPELLQIMRQINTLVAESELIGVVDLYPWLRHIAPRLTGWEHRKQLGMDIIGFLQSVVQHTKTTYMQGNIN